MDSIRSFPNFLGPPFLIHKLNSFSYECLCNESLFWKRSLEQLENRLRFVFAFFVNRSSIWCPAQMIHWGRWISWWTVLAWASIQTWRTVIWMNGKKWLMSTVRYWLSSMVIIGLWTLHLHEWRKIFANPVLSVTLSGCYE